MSVGEKCNIPFHRNFIYYTAQGISVQIIIRADYNMYQVEKN